MLGQCMESEIREQPAVLGRNAARYLEEATEILKGKDPYDMVLLAARGSSDHAALFLRYLIEINLQIPVTLAAPSVLTRYNSRVRYPRCLAIGISQSGAAPDVAEVLLALKEAGHDTLALINTPHSRVSDAAESTILLGAGPELALAATKTYSSSLLAAYQIVRALGAQLPEPELPGDEWIESTRMVAEEVSGLVVRSKPSFALGRGYSFCTAQETALKLMECALIPCKAYSVADFEHGPKALASHGSVAILYGEGPDLESQGAALIRAPIAACEPVISPVWDIFFGQWLALFVARARGLNPDRVRHLNKVTETR